MSGPATMRLAALLAREKAALLAGDMAELGALVSPKRAVMAELEKELAETGAPAALADLERDLAHVARLLEAALAGLREGQARARALRAARGGFATYDREGRAEAAPAPGRALRHKA
ncbi:hypothetical protein [Limimaricola cinnabarinus]|jgi:hypothetical protein|uniref:Flagellar biosynthesis protein FlgN n=1 Tax=Limimaricola cinnabarinus TaxID=1125964 RepID=A0A2G1MI68_9RHOB|nr:hypothetical protein [Limimaricola cinnabarinus]PHP28330.1 hypothetical protein CJ301_06245 [Limimaricola cinnabarinus]